MVGGQLKALLGVLAVAGYQNRDEIAELLRELQKPQAHGAGGAADRTSRKTSGLDDILGSLPAARMRAGLAPSSAGWHLEVL